MLSLNARNDPAVGRREDFVRPQDPVVVDYRYQRVARPDPLKPQAPVAVNIEPSPALRGAFATLRTVPQLHKVN